MSRRSPRISASGRVAVALAVTLAAGIVVVCAVAWWSTVRNLTAEIDVTLAREADAYAAAVAGAPSSQALADATRVYLSNRTGGSAGVDPILAVVFSDGRAISNSDIELEKAPENTAIASPPSQPTYSDVGYTGTSYRVLSVPVLDPEGTRIGLFQASLADDIARDTANRLAWAIAVAGLFVVAVGTALSIRVSHTSLAPLRQMAEDAAVISHGTGDARITYHGPADELGSLAESLNGMLARLERAYDEQRHFVADASHELRTPLAVIRGNAELIRDADLDANERDASLEMIENETQRMARLLDELLALARLEAGARRDFQPLHVPTLLEETVARGRALGQRRFELTCAADAWVLGDPDLLDQAMGNLVRNAVQHTEPGGLVTLSCDADERTVRISVADDGPGIPAEDLPRVFDRFYRGHGERPTDSGGAGLGLAIVSRLAQMHRGTVAVANGADGGAVFTLALPRTDAPE